MLQALSAMCAEEETHVGNYRFLRTVGKGGFSVVRVARHILTGHEVAVKIIQKKENSTSLHMLSREVSILKALSHPNIIKLFEVIEDDKKLYIVTEYASGGDLFEYLVAQGLLLEQEARAKFRQAVSALQYCHQKFIAHRDLKTENLLLDADGNIKLADFGLSARFNIDRKLETLCGSVYYTAPEIFKGHKYDGPAVDVWSLGVILYTMVSGDVPFTAQNFQDLREQVLSGEFDIPEYLSVDCVNLIKKCLTVDPHKRTTLQDIMSDPWVNVGYQHQDLKPYVEPLPDYQDPRRTALMVTMGYTLEELQESLINVKYDEIMATYLLLGYSRWEQETFTVALQPLPSPGQRCSRTPSPHHVEQHSVSAQPRQRRYSAPAILPPESLSKSIKYREKDQNLGRKAWSMTNIFASPLPGQEWEKPTSLPSRHNHSTCTSHPGNTPLLERISLSQAFTDKGRESQHTRASGASKTSSSSTESPALPHLHQQPLMALEQPSQSARPWPRVSQREGPQHGPVVPHSGHISCGEDGDSGGSKGKHQVRGEVQNLPCRMNPASPSGNSQGQPGALRRFMKFLQSNVCLGCASKEHQWERSDQGGPQEAQPRSCNFKWRMKITSSLEPQEMMRQICQVLDTLGCEWDLTERYGLLCMCGTPGQEDFLQWRMEVCRLPWWGLYGVQLKRVSGTSRAFKDIAALVVKLLQH